MHTPTTSPSSAHSSATDLCATLHLSSTTFSLLFIKSLLFTDNLCLNPLPFSLCPLLSLTRWIFWKLINVNTEHYWEKQFCFGHLKKKKIFDFLLFFLLHCFLSVVLFFFPSICPPSFLAFLYVVLYVPASVCPLTHRTDPGEICHVEIRWVWSKVQFDPTDTRAHINRLQPPTTDICPFVTTQLDRG